MISERHEADVPWHKHPIPPRGHRCFAATTVNLGYCIMQRCPCGAARALATYISPAKPGRWTQRNSRRHDVADPEYRRPKMVALIKRMVLR